MTYLELITAAYRMRNVIDENESPSAEQGVAAVDSLNLMMAEWASDSVDLQYVPITAAELASDVTLPMYARSGVIAALAVRLVAGGTITPELQSQVDSGYSAILRRAVQEGLPAQSMDHIPAGSGARPSTRFWE